MERFDPNFTPNTSDLDGAPTLQSVNTCLTYTITATDSQMIRCTAVAVFWVPDLVNAAFCPSCICVPVHVPMQSDVSISLKRC